MDKTSLYKELKNKYAQKALEEKKSLSRLSFLRLFIFVASLTVFFLLFKHFPGFAFLTLLLASAAFGRIVNLYNKKQKQKKLYENLVKINENEIKALQGDFSAYNSGGKFINAAHNYSYDLDFFGDGSLFQCLNRTGTVFGETALASWLLSPLKTIQEVKDRQIAVQELSEKNKWRQKYLAKGMFVNDREQDIEDLKLWLQKETIYFKKPFFKYIRFLMPLVIWTCLGLVLTGILSETIFMNICLIPLIIAGIKLKKVNHDHAEAGRQFKTIMKYADLIDWIEQEKFNSPYLQKLTENLKTDQRTASFYLQALAKRMSYADSRLNLVLIILGTVLFLWDIWVIYALEKYREKAKDKMLEWFKVIGEMEAVNSLATFSFNNSDFCYPTEAGEKAIEAKEIGHPLIHKKERINNSFELKKGEFSIITGPNMAGKSTFLRTIGVNFILAMAGAPVCAKYFKFQFFSLFSSMRTSDSLSKHESYFYAEIKRLKTLVDKIKSGEKVLIILDEILKGTNSHDKQQGSKKLLLNLAKEGGTGIIATHDLNLGELEKEKPESFNNKSFEMEIKDGKLYFDFLLNQGITTKMNAEYLMKSMGLL